MAQAVAIKMLKDHRVLVQSTAKSSAVLKVVPPLIIEDEDSDQIVNAFAETLADLRRGRGAAIRGLVEMLRLAPDVVLRESFR